MWIDSCYLWCKTKAEILNQPFGTKWATFSFQFHPCDPCWRAGLVRAWWIAKTFVPLRQLLKSQTLYAWNSSQMSEPEMNHITTSHGFCWELWWYLSRFAVRRNSGSRGIVVAALGGYSLRSEVCSSLVAHLCSSLGCLQYLNWNLWDLKYLRLLPSPE